MRPVITAAATALLLASCGSRDEAGNEAAMAGNSSAPENGQAAPEASGTPARLAAVELRPGQWETTVEILRMDLGNVPGMPAGVTPPAQAPVTVRSCLTPEQARRPNAGFMTGAQDQSGCSYENFSMPAGACGAPSPATSRDRPCGRRSTAASARKATGSKSESRVTANGADISTATRITARRIGDCPA